MKENQRRHDMSEICNPDKITLEEFVTDMKSALDPFQANLVNLRDSKEVGEFHSSKHYIEEWLEVFARWSEIMSEGFDPFLPDEGSES